MNSTITSTYTNCYICEIYITEREHSLMIDVYHDIRKMIYDAISQWHPKWSHKNTYKTIQDKLFTKDISIHLENVIKQR